MMMRPSRWRWSARCVLLALAWLAGATLCADAQADQWNYWAGFGPGTWHQVRQVSETVDNKGNVVARSVTRTKTTLISCNDRRVVLRVETTVELAGKRFESPPATITQGRFGEHEQDQVSVERLPKQQIRLGDDAYDCRQERIEITGDDTKRVVQLASSERVEPHELRREVTVFDDRSETISKTTSEVIAANVLPEAVLASLSQTAIVRTVHQNAKLTTNTFAVHSPDVPGHLISAATSELDSTGRIVRRNTTELVAFEVRPVESRTTYLPRGKARREFRRQNRSS